MGIALFFLSLVAGAKYDAAHHTLSARGAAAADLRAPSPAIARVKAERQARERAEKILTAALKELGHKRDVSTAKVETIDYGSDGSVSLTLTLDLAAHPTASPSPSPRPAQPAQPAQP